jgi:hypothetical protein
MGLKVSNTDTVMVSVEVSVELLEQVAGNPRLEAAVKRELGQVAFSQVSLLCASDQGQN